MKKRPSPAELAALVETFNRNHPVGSMVEYREVMPDGRDPGTEAKQFKVRAPAYVHEGHTAAVFLTGKSGFVCVSHCAPIPAPRGFVCTHDTDGDGNCGRPACPVCGPIHNPTAFASPSELNDNPPDL